MFKRTMKTFTKETVSSVVTETFAPMRDGVLLYTRITEPKPQGKRPCVFTRTPYPPKEDIVLPCPPDIDENRYTKAGYVYITQYVRGVSASQGECVPYINEKNDGLDSLDFIRSQNFYNGEIFVYGGSYPATVHLSYLGTHPADIKAAAILIQTDDLRNRDYMNGCSTLAYASWYLSMLSKHYTPEQREALNAIYKEEYKKLPYKTVLRRTFNKFSSEYGVKTPDISSYEHRLSNPPEYNPDDISYGGSNSAGALDNIKIPVLLIDGYYDFYYNGMARMWEKMSPETRACCSFAIGPFGHAFNFSPACGYKADNALLPEDMVLSWFDSARNGTPNPYLTPGEVFRYVMGEDKWLSSPDFIKKRPGYTPLYLAANGTLSKSARRAELSYIYDPACPVDIPVHSLKLQPKRKRKDGVLTFYSAPFTEDAFIDGAPALSLSVKSDCEDTAFFARLSFENEDGFWNLCDTMGTIAFFKEDYNPGDAALLTLDFTPICLRLKAGMRLRLDVSSASSISSTFAAFVPHTNTRGLWSEATETKTARNTVICGESKLLLPIKDF